MRRKLLSGWIAGLTLLSLHAQAASIYLGDNQHTGYADVALPRSLSLQWVLEAPQKPLHAWREPYYEQQFIDHDYVDHVCIAYDKVFVGSSADGAVRAVSAESGEPVWTFYTEAAVRFAPVAHQKRIYFVSDDGYLYCVSHTDGTLVWKKRCAPLDTRCSGNDRVVSRWPMRSGVIIENGKLYTASGMWSRDGVFIYCLDPKDGTEIWRNDTSGFHYSAMPHGDGFGGVSPQGPLAIAGNRLYVPTGRAAPAFFNADTGEFIFHENGLGYKPHYPGGSWVMRAGKWLVFRRRHNHGESEVPDSVRQPSTGFGSGLIFYNQMTGNPEMAWTDKNMAVVHGNEMVLAGAGAVVKVDFARLQREYLKYDKPEKGGLTVRWDPNVVDSNYKDMRSLTKQFGGGQKVAPYKLPRPAYMSPLPYAEWSHDAGHVYAVMMTDDRAFLGGEDKITALDLETGDKLWGADVAGEVRGVAMDDGKVLASTTEGRIYCFGGGKGGSTAVRFPTARPALSAKRRERAEQLLSRLATKAGHGLILGAQTPGLIMAVLEASDLTLSCYTDDEQQAAALRRRLDRAGLLGTRCSVFVGDRNSVPFMKYMFNVVFAAPDFGAAAIPNPEAVYQALRPYGGKLVCMTGSPNTAAAAFDAVVTVNDSMTQETDGFVLTRGALVGAGEWTAPFANMGRTSNSEDDIVKPPLGILWWGGPGGRRIMSRHWVSPVPLFSQGIMVIQGRNDILAVDAYNGREIWNRNMHKIGRALMPMRGGNIVADESHVYCVKETTAHVLDLRTGRTVREIEFRPTQEEAEAVMALGKQQQFRKNVELRLAWEYLGLVDNVLIGSLSAEDAADDPRHGGSLKSPPLSRTIFAFDVTPQLREAVCRYLAADLTRTSPSLTPAPVAFS